MGLLALIAGIAQDALAVDLDLFELSPALARGTGSPQGEAPTTGLAGPTAGVFGVYSREPVLERTTSGETPAVLYFAPVMLHAGASVDARVRADLSLPLYALLDAPLSGFYGRAPGDLRLQLTIPLGSSDGPVDVALIPSIGMPTGYAPALVSRGWVEGLRLAVGGGGPESRLGWLVNAGGDLAHAEPLYLGEGTEGETGLRSRSIGVASAWVRMGPARLGAELDAQWEVVPLAELPATTGHLFGQLQSQTGLGLVAGAGTGLVAGVGSPRWRVFGGLTWTAVRHDADDDGIVDRLDPCSEVPEDFDDFMDEDGCPERDNDGDGVNDEADSCPNEPEDMDAFEDIDGCPDPDNDRDQIVDTMDRCPDLAGPATTGGCPDTDGDTLADLDDRCPTEAGAVAMAGCPDRDGDGYADPDDACPDKPGPDQGCPVIAVVTREQIEIKERVEFELGSSTLVAESAPVLDAVVRVLLREPTVLRVEVQGHTDNVGSEKVNLKLSQARAEAVVHYLVTNGVAPERLVAKGYGEMAPMFTNKTAKGREQNRRVQFVILERGVP